MYVCIHIIPIYIYMCIYIYICVLWKKHSTYILYMHTYTHIYTCVPPSSFHVVVYNMYVYIIYILISVHHLMLIEDLHITYTYTHTWTFNTTSNETYVHAFKTWLTKWQGNDTLQHTATYCTTLQHTTTTCTTLQHTAHQVPGKWHTRWYGFNFLWSAYFKGLPHNKFQPPFLVRTPINIYIYAYTYIYIYMYMYMYIYVYLNTHVYIQTQSHMYIYIRIDVYICTYI